MANWRVELNALKANRSGGLFPELEIHSFEIEFKENMVILLNKRAIEEGKKQFPNYEDYLVNNISRIDKNTGKDYNIYKERDPVYNNERTDLIYKFDEEERKALKVIKNSIFSKFPELVKNHDEYRNFPFGDHIQYLNFSTSFFVNQYGPSIQEHSEAIPKIEALRRFYFGIAYSELAILNIDKECGNINEVNLIRSFSNLTECLSTESIQILKETDNLKFLLRENPNLSLDLLKTLLEWMAKNSENNQIIRKLEELRIDDVNKLNLIVGISALKNILEIWENNNNDSNEEFWQKTLQENSIILSQLFSFPIVITKGKAYVGGKNIYNKGGNIVDLLLSNKLTKNSVLIEIKTPVTKMISTEYRDGIFNISQELSGAVIQISAYKDSLIKEFKNIKDDSDEAFEVFNPGCIVIAGNFKKENLNSAKRKSFELFRNGLKDVQIITFDELFAKVQILLHLLEGNDL